MTEPVCITILMDNTAAAPSLSAEHGLSMWIQVGDKHLLWDTGQSDKLFDNAQQLGIDISKADAVVLSHGHYDHTGGLLKVIQSAPDASFYLHPKAMDPKYSLKNDCRRFIGISRDTQLQLLKQDMAGRVIYVDRKTEIFSGVIVTGPVPRHTEYETTGGLFFIDAACESVDELNDDQSLYFNSTNGIIVVLGCAHSGVVNVLNAVSRWTGSSKIYAVIGGMHLVNADSARIEKTIAAFKQYDIQKIVPLHCTGTKAAQQLKQVFGNRCLSLGAGSQLCFTQTDPIKTEKIND